MQTFPFPINSFQCFPQLAKALENRQPGQLIFAEDLFFGDKSKKKGSPKRYFCTNSTNFPEEEIMALIGQNYSIGLTSNYYIVLPSDVPLNPFFDFDEVVSFTCEKDLRTYEIKVLGKLLPFIIDHLFLYFRTPVKTIGIWTSSSITKVSFHIHVSMEGNHCFRDTKEHLEFARETQKITTAIDCFFDRVDLAVYGKNNQLFRLPYCEKQDGKTGVKHLYGAYAGLDHPLHRLVDVAHLFSPKFVPISLVDGWVQQYGGFMFVTHPYLTTKHLAGLCFDAFIVNTSTDAKFKPITPIKAIVAANNKKRAVERKSDPPVIGACTETQIHLFQQVVGTLFPRLKRITFSSAKMKGGKLEGGASEKFFAHYDLRTDNPWCPLREGLHSKAQPPIYRIYRSKLLVMCFGYHDLKKSPALPPSEERNPGIRSFARNDATESFFSALFPRGMCNHCFQKLEADDEQPGACKSCK